MSKTQNIPILHDLSLKSLSTFGVGGLVKNYIPVESSAGLVKVLDYLKKEGLDFNVFSGGSNVVFPDAGLESYLIHLKSGSFRIRNNVVFADAGVDLSAVVHASVQKRLAGLENLSGIPGSLGGAVVGNAGAYGSSISDSVKKIQIWDKGRLKLLSREECLFKYRDSVFKHGEYIVLRVLLELKNTSEDLHKKAAEIIKIREQKYKPGLKCPGSFFKNVLVTEVAPQVLSKINQSVIIGGKIPAGYLLTEIGARGRKIGGIVVSDFHGNLLINNKGNGTANEVRELSETLKKMVFNKFGINLEEEVRFL